MNRLELANIIIRKIIKFWTYETFRVKITELTKNNHPWALGTTRVFV